MSYPIRVGLLGVALLLAFVAIAVSAGQGRAEDIRLDALKIPVRISGPGRPASVELEAIVG